MTLLTPDLTFIYCKCMCVYVSIIEGRKLRGEEFGCLLHVAILVTQCICRVQPSLVPRPWV